MRATTRAAISMMARTHTCKSVEQYLSEPKVPFELASDEPKARTRNPRATMTTD
jgi:hypothetical protein